MSNSRKHTHYLRSFHTVSTHVDAFSLSRVNETVMTEWFAVVDRWTSVFDDPMNCRLD